MRINVQGDSALTGMLRKAGYEVSDSTWPHYTVYFQPGDKIVVDATDSELERNIVNCMAELTELPITLQRAGGVQSDREIRITVPPEAKEAVEQGVFRGVLKTIHTPRPSRWKKLVIPGLILLAMLFFALRGHAQQVGGTPVTITDTTDTVVKPGDATNNAMRVICVAASCTGGGGGGGGAVQLQDGAGNPITSTGNALDINEKSSTLKTVAMQVAAQNSNGVDMDVTGLAAARLQITCSGCGDGAVFFLGSSDGVTFSAVNAIGPGNPGLIDTSVAVSGSSSWYVPVAGLVKLRAQVVGATMANTITVTGTAVINAAPSLLTNINTITSVLNPIDVNVTNNPGVFINNASIPVTGTFWQVTQPISGNVGQTGTWNIGTVSTITNPVAVTESGTWTVQPGNTANTTPWLFKLMDAAGNVRGANVNASNQLSISVDNTPNIGTVTSITNTVTVGGTVTANAGSNLNTSALALESGGNLAAIAQTVGRDNVAAPTTFQAIGGVDVAGMGRVLLTDTSGGLYTQQYRNPGLPLPACNPLRRTNCQPVLAFR